MAHEQVSSEPDLGAAVTEAQRLLDHGDTAGAQTPLARRWSVPAGELELRDRLGKLVAGLSQARRGGRAAAEDPLMCGAELVGRRPPHGLGIGWLRSWSHTVQASDTAGPAPVADLPVPRSRLL
ncbi:hypothetical protein [Nocardia stercoris]|uniref:Uncharacterized protein n=1 Tax=Nocardia stercoris TaxID=2483361 RepID=A0A3M2L4P6_9NOCA|nr:hypothetical protein [Nocardia stercoris]RMI32354.1 hypothetical protein EBN03_15420 [Nocardia stercoris]